MTSASRLVCFVACCACVVVGIAAPTRAAHAQTSSLAGNAVPTLSDPAGKVAVVGSSAQFEGRVAFIVENGTDHPVSIRSVGASATNASGAAAVRASTRDVVPARLAPGDTAIGQVRWRAGTVDADAAITWSVASRRAAVAADPATLDPSNFVLSGPLAGDVAQTLTFDVTNLHVTPRFGPFAARVLCLNEANLPVVLVATDPRHGRLGPGSSASLLVPMRVLCPSYVVAVAARLER